MAFCCLKAAVLGRFVKLPFFLSLIYRMDLLDVAAAADEGTSFWPVRDKTV